MKSTIITISGRPGSGKSVVAKALAKKLKLKHYSTGELMRKMARQRGMTLMALTQKARRDNGKIDRMLDEYQVQLGKTKKNFVIDGRLGFYFIPHSIKMFLDVSPLVAAQRIAKQRRGGVEKLRTLAEAQRELKRRTEAEQERYKKYYGADYMQKKNYDLAIDTTRQSVDGVVKRILGFLKKKHHI